jgi:putative ABC transport system ATP-binding protein
MNVIELKNVGKEFRDTDPATVVLQDVNMTVAQGEFVAIMGPSGSGKSTLMNIIGLLDAPTSGEYLIDGDTVKGMSDKALAKLRLKKIGFIFQTFNLIPKLTVAQNVELPMIYGGLSAKQRKARSIELLELIGIADRSKNKPNTISGGQTQRVAIARALANQPSLILADEPTGNLDSVSGKTVMDELKRLNGTGVTIVLITHDPDIAAVADRIIRVKDGQIVKAAK